MAQQVLLSWTDEKAPRICTNPTIYVPASEAWNDEGVQYIFRGHYIPTPSDQQIWIENRGVLIIDCTTAGEIGADNTITDHPVEKGSPISDHVVLGQRRVQLSGIISNHPIVEGSAGYTSVTRVLAAPFGINKFLVEDVEGTDVSDENRKATAYFILNEIRKQKRLCRIVLDLEVFENMVCQSLVIPLEAATAEALKFSMTFREVLIISAKYGTASIKPVAPPVAHAQGNADKGEKPAEKLDTASVLVKGLKKWNVIPETAPFATGN